MRCGRSAGSTTEQDAGDAGAEVGAPEQNGPEDSDQGQSSAAAGTEIEEATDGLVGFDLGELPEDFPADVVPLLAGEVLQSTEMALGEAAKVWKVTIVPDLAAEDIPATVQAQLTDAGFDGEWSNAAENISQYSSGDSQEDLFQVTVELTTDDGRPALAYGVTRHIS